MNVIGILKNHDPEIKCARDLDELLSGPALEKTVIEQVISYLKQGKHTFKFIAYDYDADKQSMGQRMYLTDGEWIWPSYYVYYLEKYPGIAVPKFFLEHVYSKKNVPDLSREEMFYAEYITDKLLTSPVPQNRKPPIKIQHLLEARGEELVCF